MMMAQQAMLRVYYLPGLGFYLLHTFISLYTNAFANLTQIQQNACFRIWQFFEDKIIENLSGKVQTDV